MRSKQAWPEMTVASPEQRESGMGVIEIGPEAGPVEEARGRIYAFLGALFSHPDTGKWGRVLNADEQRLAIATADALRARACGMKYLVLADELPGSELDLRFLVVELCQPLEHLKAEYERRPVRPPASARVFAVRAGPSERDHWFPPRRVSGQSGRGLPCFWIRPGQQAAPANRSHRLRARVHELADQPAASGVPDGSL